MIVPEKRGNEALEAKFGLPSEVKFCKRCVISNQRPNSTVEHTNVKERKIDTIHFNGDGVCDACRAVERNYTETDWDEREGRLRDLCGRFRRDDGHYDCLVPGSGGKDSFFAAHKLKYEYGMHPLTVTWAAHLYTDWGWRNMQSWIHSGFDNVLITPNGRVKRLLARLALENLFFPFQSFVYGQKALIAKMSLLYDIPLVFFGENEAEYGNPIANNQSAIRDAEFHSADDTSKIFLSGVSLPELEEDYGVHPSELQHYIPAGREELGRTEIHYLGYYLRWHPQGCYYYATEHSGFTAAPERTPGTYSKYNSIDDKMDDLHYYTTHVKFGIGRATYDASQEIRHDEITREEGVALVRRFDGEFPERFVDELFKYLSLPEDEFPAASKRLEQPVMDRDYLNSLADSFRSAHLWKFENGSWSLRRPVWEESSEGTPRP